MEIIKDLPASDYHKIKALSASSAKLLLRSPLHYLAAMSNPREPSAAMRLGTLCHTLVFEPEKFEEEFAVAPRVDKRTKFGKEALANFEEEHEGKLVIDEFQYEKAKAIAAAALSHPMVTEYMVGGSAEATMLWEQYGVPCKARVDYLCGDVMFDLKTCQDATPGGFSRQIGTFQYHIQAAHYANGYEAITGRPLSRFVFIAVESDSPHMTGVYEIDRPAFQSGDVLMRKAAHAFKAAASGTPLVARYSDDILKLTLPGWALSLPFDE